MTKASTAKTTPQPLPQTGGSFSLKAGKLTNVTPPPKAPTKTDKPLPEADTPTKDA